MNIRKAYLAMIKEYPGGWDAMSAALGMTRDALENRIYERKGQSVLVETALQMQIFSASSHFADAAHWCQAAEREMSVPDLFATLEAT